jgi:hypothetical protein
MDLDREEAELWRLIDPHGHIHPEHLAPTHRLAIVWAIYQMLHLAQDFLDHTLPALTKRMGLIIGGSVSAGVNLLIKAVMHAVASESDPFLSDAVHLWFANLPPDIAGQADGVIQFLRSEASALKSTRKVRERLTMLVRDLEALFHKLDVEEEEPKMGRPPYQMPPAVYDLLHAVVEHHRMRIRAHNHQRLRAVHPRE